MNAVEAQKVPHLLWLSVLFAPDSFGGSLDFLQNQTSSMPALRTMIEYYKDIFCDQPLGQGGVG